MPMTITLVFADTVFLNPELTAIIRLEWISPTAGYIEMKTMTCNQLGGSCQQKLSAESWHDMVAAMTKHVMEKHPEVAESMKAMHERDPQEWGQKMKPKWDTAPEVMV